MPDPRPLILPPITDPGILAQIERLARRQAEAAGPVMKALGRLGLGGERLLARLPAGWRAQLDRATRAGLDRAFSAAGTSRRILRPRGDWFNRLGLAATGAAGGAAGLAGALAELPVMISLLLRAMLEIAEEHGFEPDDEAVRLECLRIFAAAGPVPDETEPGLGTARLPIAGSGLQGLIGTVAPRLSMVMGQKLAAQSAPVVGALAGASLNYAFTRYYQELARVHFGLLRLARETGLPREALAEALELALRRA